ncbi:MAG: hypothetical protein M3N32_07805 [Actinomycetota bacterium]|nr:hypothetical protein [Actinomycetota bacterium]
MRFYAHLMGGLAGLDLGLALVLLYEMTKRILDGDREWLGYAVLVFAWGVIGDFIAVVRFLGEPDRVRPGYVVAAVYVILILAGWSMADIARNLKSDPRPDVQDRGSDGGE